MGLPGQVIAPVTERVVRRIRFPRLLMLLATLLVFDLVIPDLIPWVDEIFLGLMTALLAAWRQRRVERLPAR